MENHEIKHKVKLNLYSLKDTFKFIGMVMVVLLLIYAAGIILYVKIMPNILTIILMGVVILALFINAALFFFISAFSQMLVEYKESLENITNRIERMATKEDVDLSNNLLKHISKVVSNYVFISERGKSE